MPRRRGCAEGPQQWPAADELGGDKARALALAAQAQASGTGADRVGVSRAGSPSSRAPPRPLPGQRAARDEMAGVCSARAGAAGGLESAGAAAALRDRVKGALYGLLIADALAAPSHWLYGGPRQVVQLYGRPIEGYVKPVVHLPGSIMSKSSTGGGGRGSWQGEVVGAVILHGKKEFWRPGSDFHYHCQLEAGDNTLEALLVRRVLAVVGAQPGAAAVERLPREAVLADYVTFMTTPGSHNDTYAGTSHRMFFANYAAGRAPADCPDNDGHNVDAACALVTAVPSALVSRDDGAAMQDAAAMVRLTRDSPAGARVAQQMAAVLRAVVAGRTGLRDACLAGAKDVGVDLRRAGEQPDPLTACYLDSSYPAVLLMAYKYGKAQGADEDARAAAERFRRGLLANSNRGGENVNTGAVLGALLGAEIGFARLPRDLVQGLAPRSRPALDNDVEAFLDRIALLKV